MKRSKVGTRSEHLKMIKKLEYHLKSTFNRSVADRERKITLAREAYKPLLDFYSSLYGKKGLSLKKYATEVSREMDRHTYEAHPLRQGGSGFPSLFPLLSPHDATKDIPVKWQGKVAMDGYDFIVGPFKATSGQVDASSLYSPDEMRHGYLGGTLIAPNGGSGWVSLFEGAGILLQAEDDGNTLASMDLQVFGSFGALSLFGYLSCEITVELTVYDITLGTLTPEVPPVQRSVLDVQALTGAYDKPFNTISTSQETLSCNFERKAGHQYSIGGYLRCSMAQIPFNDWLTDRAIANIKPAFLGRFDLYLFN